jgi:hypothetical protein
VRALLRALIGAAQWADLAENRRAVANLLVEARYISVPIEVVQAGLAGQVRFGREPGPRAIPDFIVLHRYAANFPWLSQASWFADALTEAGLTVRPSKGLALGFRPDLYVEAAGDLRVAYPLVESKDEGAHEHAWTLSEATQPISMGPEVRFDTDKS